MEYAEGFRGELVRVLHMEARADHRLGESASPRPEPLAPNPKFDKIQAEAERINQKVRDVVMEQAKRNSQSEKAFAQMAAWSAKMEELFTQKPPDRKLVGYQTHHEWLIGTLPPRLGISERQAEYIGRVGTHLYPLIGEKGIVELGAEKCKVCAAVVKERGKLPADILTYAQKENTTATDVKRRAMAKGPNGKALLPSHEELHKNGPWAEYLLEGPREWIKSVKQAIEVGRFQLGDAASDAEVLAFMVADKVVEMANEEQRAKDKAAGLDEAKEDEPQDSTEV